MIVLKPAADRDLAEASDWYESKQNGLGVDFLVEVDRTLTRIENRPAGYRKVRGELRRAMVMHHRRAPAEWQKRYEE